MVTRTREVRLDGLEELDRMANRIAPKKARSLARSSVHKVAGQVRDEMRQRAPKDDGTLRRAIFTKRERGTQDSVSSAVRIAHGKTAKHDAWYWHMVEFGTVRLLARPFIEPTVENVQPKLPNLYREEFGRRLEKELEREARKMGVAK